LEREAAVLRSRIHGELLVGQAFHGHGGRERARLERIDAVRQLDLRVVRRLVERSVAALTAFPARHAELSGQPLVVLEVAESVARTELARGRLPAERRTVHHVARVVGLDDAELTDVVIDGDRVVESRQQLTSDPEARREAATEE